MGGTLHLEVHGWRPLNHLTALVNLGILDGSSQEIKIDKGEVIQLYHFAPVRE